MAIAAGHKILNHKREEILVSRRTLRSLDMRQYLYRDRPTGLLAFKPAAVNIYRAVEGAHPRPDFYYELGEDITGPNVVVCHCEKCSFEKHIVTPEEQHTQTDKIIRDVRNRRMSHRQPSSVTL